MATLKIGGKTATNKNESNVQNAQVSNPKSESPMMKQYKQLKEKHPDAMLLFRCGDFYETYEDDAKAASEVLGITLTKSTKTGVQMAGFPFHALDTYLPKLIRAGHRVAICDQLEAPAPKATVKRQAPAPAKEDKPVVVPLGEHGTLVVGKPGFSPQPAEDAVAEEIKDETPKAAPKKVTLKEKTPQPKSEQPVAETLPEVTFATYKTKRGKTAPQIIGFSGEDDPRWKRHAGGVHKWVSASWYKDVSGEKCYRLMFGVRYMDVAKTLTEAYNTADRKAWEDAERKCEDEYKQAQAEGKAAFEAKKAEWAAKKAERKAKKEEEKKAKTADSSYDAKTVAEMLKAIMAGGDIPEDVKKLMAA